MEVLKGIIASDLEYLLRTRVFTQTKFCIKNRYADVCMSSSLILYLCAGTW